MKWLSWAIAVLGLNMLISGVMVPGMNIVGIICGLLIAVLAVMGALKG
jgi:hypothetical protein